MNTIIIVLIFIIILYYLIHNTDITEGFENYLPIIDRYICFDNNNKLIEFTHNMNRILDEYKITDGEIEISTKFSINNINPNRIVIFFPYDRIVKEPELENKLYQTMIIDKNIIDKLKEYILKTKFDKAQLLFGLDLNEKSKRIYFNYIYKKQPYLVAYNIQKELVARKVYEPIKKELMIKEMKKIFGKDIVINLIEVFPMELWSVTGVKKDTRITFLKNSSFYIKLKFEFSVKQFGDGLLNLIKKIYKMNDEKLKKWYDCFKDNNIVWISLGINKDKIFEFTLYMVHNRFIRTKVDINKIINISKLIKINT